MADWTPPEAAAEEWSPPEAVKPSGPSVVTFKSRQPIDTLFQEDSSEPGSFGMRLGPQAIMPTKSRLPAGRAKAEAGSLEATRAPHEDEFLPMQSTTASERRSAAMKELDRRLSPQAAAGEVAAGLDMVAGLLSLGVKIFTRGFGQVVAELGAGVSHKAANMVADELAAEWSDSNVIAAQPFRRLMAFLGMGEAYDESHISKAMEWLMKHQEELLEKPIEEKTGGALTQSDVRWIVESAMFTLGTRGMQSLVQPKGPRPTSPKKMQAYRMGETQESLRTARPEDILAKFEEPEAPPTPEAAELKPFKKEYPTLGKLKMVDEFGRPLAVAGAVGLAAYAATEDGGDSVTLAALAAMPISRRLDRVSEALPKVDPIRGMIDAARVGGPSALHHLDNARMELVARGAPRELLRELDTATRAMEVQQYGKTEIPSWVLPAYAATAVVNKKLDDYNRLRDSQKMLKEWKEDSRIPVEAGVGFISLAALTRMPEATPFKVLHEQTRYTTKFLDHVAKKYPGQWDFSVKQLRQELGKAGAGAEERAVFEQILGKRERITAKELIGETRVAVGDFELTPKVFEGTSHYEPYGLERIDRIAADEYGGYTVPEGVDVTEISKAPPARTTIYQSPLDLPPSPHFPDTPNYFGHTRSFNEGGIRHVEEVQSDLMQRLGKVLSPESRAALETVRGAYEEGILSMEEAGKVNRPGIDYAEMVRARTARMNDYARQHFAEELEQKFSAPDAVSALKELDEALEAKVHVSPWFRTRVEAAYENALTRMRLRLAEVSSKLRRSELEASVLPITRDWYKRLIREEVAEAAARYSETQNLIASKQKEIAEIREFQTNLTTPKPWAIGELTKWENAAYDLDVLSMDLRNGHVSEGTAKAYMLKTEKLLPPEARAAWEEYYIKNADETEGFLRPEPGEDGLWGKEYAAGFPKVMADFLKEQIGKGEAKWAGEAIARYLDDIARLEEQAKPIARFATADTVAKVEGWPEQFGEAVRSARNSVRILEEDIRRASGPNPRWWPVNEETLPQYLNRLETRLAEARQLLKELEANEAAGKSNETRFGKNQLLYDRYRNGVEKFLRSEYRARDYTDSAGHTWLEIDLPKEPPQIAIWGAAGAAVGAGLLATWLDGGDESPLALAALAAVPAKGRAAKILPAAAAIGAGAALTAYLSDPGNKALNAGLAAAMLGVAAYAKSSNPVIKRWAEGSGLAAEVVFGNLSSELRTMSEPLLRRMTNHERLLKIREHNALRQISPFAEAVVKLPDNLREALDMALMSSDRRTATKLIDSLGRPELSSALRATYAYIDNTGTELQRFNLVKKLGADHFPRIVTDLDGLMAKLGRGGQDYLGKKLGEANTQKLKRSGDPLNDIEMSRIVNEHLQAAINQSDLGGQSGILKKRSIAELRKELLPFYATAGDSIAIYARAASREIERARFFGKDLRQAKDTLAVNVDASIGALVKAERAAGNLSPEGLQRLESLLRARFGPGERSGHYITQSYRSIVQALLLGNPFSAMTQFGDAAIAVAIHGVLPTIKGVGQAILDTANSKLGTTAKWRLEDFGLVQHITEDLVRGSREPYRIGGYEISSAKFLDKTLKWSGFSFVDEFSKLVNLNAAAARFEKLARTETGRAEIMRRYGEYFGGDSARLIEDLKVGRKSPLVGELIFRELSDLQPITKLEMSQGYLASPNTRPAFVLKSFMVKQMNLVRERGFREIAKGDAASVARGTEFLVRYSLALGMSGAGLTLITNWLLGKATDLEMADVAENVFKTFGWSSYAIDKAKKEGLVTAAVGTVLPPFKLFDDIARTPGELRKWIDGDPKANPKGVSYIPIVGKLIYHRVLGGAEKADAREEKLKARKERERLKELMGD